MKRQTARPGITLRSGLFEVLQVVAIIGVPVVLIYWFQPSLTLHMLVVWGGVILLMSLIRFLMSRSSRRRSRGG